LLNAVGCAAGRGLMRHCTSAKLALRVAEAARADRNARLRCAAFDWLALALAEWPAPPLERSLSALEEAHRAGAGAAFTRAYPVEAEVDPATYIADTESWERAETLHRMRVSGIGAVRGWMWTTVRLTHAHRVEFRRQLAERFSACRSCGSLDHFIEQCDQRREAREARDADEARDGPVVFRRVRRPSAREDRSERRSTPPIS
jgi:hypothetical protein